MTNHAKKICVFFIIFAAVAQISHARVNILEQYYSGQDSTIHSPGGVEPMVSMLLLRSQVEIPAEFSYVLNNRTELGARLGLINTSSNTGFDDLILAAKYKMLEESSDTPAILGEAGLSLPTGSYSDGLGTGGLGFILCWEMEKMIKQTRGYFSLGMRMNSENPDKYRYGSVFFYTVGATRPYKHNLDLDLALKGFSHGNAKRDSTEINNAYQELYLAPGVVYQMDAKTTFAGSLLIGLTSDSSSLGLVARISFK